MDIKTDVLYCNCEASDLKPSSKCLRKYGFYLRRGNKVRRYQCKDCSRILSFPPKKKSKKKVDGHLFSLKKKRMGDFYSFYEYCFVNTLLRASIISGFDFYKSMERFTGLSRSTISPRISRKEAFADMFSCAEVLHS